MKTPLLDSIDMSTAATMRSLNTPDAATACASCGATGGKHDPKCRRDPVDTLAASLVAGETDETTYAALATLYDMKRDRAVLSLTKLCAAYGDEMNKREITAVHAAPLIAEMMRVLDAAVAAQVRALNHRCAAGSARTDTPAKGAR